MGRGRVQKVEETLATTGLLGRRVRRERMEYYNARKWFEREECAVEPAAWGGFYHGSVIRVCVGRFRGRGTFEHCIEGKEGIRRDGMGTELKGEVSIRR